MNDDNPKNSPLFPAEVTAGLLATARCYGLPDVLLAAMQYPGHYVVGLQSGKTVHVRTVRLYKESNMWVRLELVEDERLREHGIHNMFPNENGVVDVRLDAIVWAWRKGVTLPD